jgi:hypothetical protein
MERAEHVGPANFDDLIGLTLWDRAIMHGTPV